MTITARIHSRAPEDTWEIGRIIGAEAQSGDIFLLTGPLGAGKTALTQGIAGALGVEGYVRSPTFVLMTRYRGRLTLHHVDLYRIEDPMEAWDLGLEEDLFGDGVCVVEWADKAAEFFPDHAIWISLDYGTEESRRTIAITLSDNSPRHISILKKLSRGFPGLDLPDLPDLPDLKEVNP